MARLALLPGVALLATATMTSGVAHAATAPVPLGTAKSYAVLAGPTVTNTPLSATVINGDLGVSPGTATTGFDFSTPPGAGHVFGAVHLGDAPAGIAQNDLTTAFGNAAGRTGGADVTGVDLGGKTLAPGVYNATSAMALTGPIPLTLNGGGDPDAVFIFQAGTTLITGSDIQVKLVNGA
jgi:hypothetical protein